MGTDGVQTRGMKRAREEREAAEGGEVAGMISPARFNSLRTLIARTFARLGEQQIPRGELLENINSGLTEGESLFTEDEFAVALEQLERENKVMNVAETGDVIHVG